MKYIIINLIFFFFFIHVVFAQTTDTLTLQEVEITSEKNIETNFNKTISIDSTRLQYLPTANLAELLQKYTPFFIKSYGINGLNTPAFRGTSANHTIVEWNGLELNSAMNGQFDLSALPIFLADEVKIKYGAASLKNSTGGFGGLLQLSNNLTFFKKPQKKIFQSYETLNNFFSAFNFGFSKKKFTHQTTILKKNYRNQFSYKNPFLNNKLENTEHANNILNGILQQYGYLTKKAGIFLLDAWYSSDYRQLPTLMGSFISSKEQQNTENFRTALTWKLTKKLGTIKSINGYIYEQMQYKDENKKMNFIHFNNTFTNKNFFHSTKTKLGYFNLSMHYKFQDVRSDNYSAYHNRNTIGGYSEWQYNIGTKFQTIIHAGQEWIDNKWMPGSGFIGLNILPFSAEFLKINTTASKNYRYPTMNDMYWEIYGNPRLKPEINYSYEINTILKKTFNEITFQQQVTIYYSQIKDMLVWHPVTAIWWQPSNLNTVEAKGIELHSSIQYKTKNSCIQLSGNYTFNKVIVIHSLINDTSIINKQLPYNPQHSISSAIDVAWKKYFFNGHFQFVSDYFINYQNTYQQPYIDYMPWYSLVSAGLGKKWNYKSSTLTTAINVQNILNTSYMTMPARPMPPRYFQFWIALQIN